MATILDEVNVVASRRQFLKASIVLGGVIASTQLIGKETLLRAISPDEAKQLATQATQVTTVFRNLSNSGSGMITNTIDVMNGRIVRIRPMHYDWLYTPSSFGAYTVPANGGTMAFAPPLKTLPAYFDCAYKQRVYSPARVKYPMMRTDFDYTKAPADRLQKNRGVSGFVRITWDQALTIMASELTRLKTTYGPASMLVMDDQHGESKIIHPAHGSPYSFLYNYFGGCTTTTRNPDSWEGYYWGGKQAWGCDGAMGEEAPQTNCLWDFMQNGQVGFFWGSDPETTPNGHSPGGMASVACYWMKAAGKRIIYVEPDLNFAAAVHADKWIPVLPNTDSAFELAIAYVWITEGTYDHNYIATHTLGFDETSLPTGAPAGGSFKSYLLGITDGVPKTPKWAEAICGVPSWTIKATARTWASNVTSVLHSNGGSAIRGPYCHEPGRTMVYLLAMQGVGKPGVHMIKMHEWYLSGWPWATPSAHISGAAGNRGIVVGGATVPFISKQKIPEAIMGTPLDYWGSGVAGALVPDQFIECKYPVQGYSPVHAIWSGAPCTIACMGGGNSMVQALRSQKIEFYVTQGFTLENNSLFADLVLPVTTTFENDIDLGADYGSGQYATFYVQEQACLPIGESKADDEIVEAVAAKLGLDFTKGKTHLQWAQAGFAACPGVPSNFTWDNLMQLKYFMVPPDPNWKNTVPGLTTFYNLPTGANLDTKSGKIEFFSGWLFQYFPNDTERPPLAHYIANGKTHQESLSSPRAALYPLLVESNHPRWREHVNMDDNEWLREIWSHKIKGPDGYMYQPMWIHPTTAAKYGIKYGDIVRIYNERGAVLAAAAVTERLIPGAISIDHGARLDPLALNAATQTLNEYAGPDSSGIVLDRGGEINLIAPYKGPSANCGNGEVTSGYLAQIEKVDLAALKAKYPAGFKRPYDPNVGLTNDSWATGAPVVG